MNELQRIVARTRVEVDQRRAQTPLRDLGAVADRRDQQDPIRGFTAALAAPGLSVIAEHKRRSPSAGVIRSDIELEDVVSAYERGGARALSVLTEAVGFGGNLDDLARARRAATLPILRKDFVVDEYQVVEAVAAGADAILLIVAALDPADLRSLYARARGFGLGVLVEVHDGDELAIAAAIEPEVIGINNRDLTTLQVDTARTFELIGSLPAETVIVSESGLRTPEDVAAVAAAGIDAVLVGEALMRSADIEAACRALTGFPAPAPTMD
jgi:indole-3-glycerol phosphate synthase